MKFIKFLLENTEAVTAIITFLSGALYRLIDYLKHRTMNNMHILLDKQSDTFNALDLLQEQIHCDRVAVMAAHNGNKRIDISSVNMLYSSVLASVKNGDIRDIKKIWKNQPIDKHYIKMLAQVSERKVIRTIVEDMPNSIAKPLLTQDGISVTYTAEVKVIEKPKYHKLISSKKEIYKYVYLVCHFKDLVIDDSSISEQIRLTAQEVEKLV